MTWSLNPILHMKSLINRKVEFFPVVGSVWLKKFLRLFRVQKGLSSRSTGLKGHLVLDEVVQFFVCEDR